MDIDYIRHTLERLDRHIMQLQSRAESAESLKMALLQEWSDCLDARDKLTEQALELLQAETPN